MERGAGGVASGRREDAAGAGEGVGVAGGGEGVGDWRGRPAFEVHLPPPAATPPPPPPLTSHSIPRIPMHQTWAAQGGRWRGVVPGGATRVHFGQDV